MCCERLPDTSTLVCSRLWRARAPCARAPGVLAALSRPPLPRALRLNRTLMNVGVTHYPCLFCVLFLVCFVVLFPFPGFVCFVSFCLLCLRLHETAQNIHNAVVHNGVKHSFPEDTFHKSGVLHAAGQNSDFRFQIVSK